MPILFALLLLSGGVNAQLDRQRFDNLDTGDFGDVHVLVEDANGFIWVGGDGGLARFDGHQLVRIASDEMDSGVNDLALIDQRQLWIAGDQQLARWDLDSERLTVASCDAFSEGAGQLQAIGQDLLALTRAGLQRVDGATLACQSMDIAGIPDGQPIERFLDDGAVLWLAVRDRGLWRCAKPCVTALPWAPELATTRIRWISAAADHGFYIGTHRQGLFRLDGDGVVRDHWWRGADAPADRAITTNGVMSLQRMPDGRLYAGLWAGGVIEIGADGAVASRSRTLPHEATSVAGVNVRVLFHASNGTVWVGHEKGLSILDPVRNSVPWIGPAAEGQSGLSSPVVRAMVRHGNSLLVGTGRGGINRVELDSGVITAFEADSERSDALPSNSIWDMLDRGDGQLLLATSGGLVRFSMDTWSATTLATTPALPSDDVVSIATARDGGYWAAAWAGGVVRLDASGRIQRVWGADDGLVARTMIAVFEDSGGRVLTGNSEGLFALGADRQFHAVAIDGPARQGKRSDVSSFMESGDGTLWMGISSGGLARWRSASARPEWVNDAALGDTAIIAIAPRAGGGLWLGTSSRGLLAVDGSGNVVAEIGRRNGLEFDSVLSLLPDADGTLWVGGMFGIHHITANALAPVSSIRSPMVTGVRLFNRPLRPDPDGPLTSAPAWGGKLRLRYDQELLTLDFALPGLPQPDGLRFRYRLQDFDRDWVEVSADEARAVYTRLPPGSYQFQVEAGDRDGWSGNPVAFPVTVSPPLWMTWWARAGLVLFVVLLLALGHWLRTWQLRRQALRLEQTVNARTAELRDANRALQRAARTDALTQLVNRRGFKDAIESRWAQLTGNAALLLADIDHFKAINDSHGHDAGDSVLVAVAGCLQATASHDDVVARWGGEEFLCLLVGDAAPQRAEAMRRAVAGIGETTAADAPRISITAGFTAIRQGESFIDAARRADALLYEGKRSGRDRVVFDGHATSAAP